jgi:hypothetical protein
VGSWLVNGAFVPLGPQLTVSSAARRGKSTSVRASKSGGAAPNGVAKPMSFVGSPMLKPERSIAPVITS